MEQEIAKDIELETRKVERKDVDAAEENKVSSPMEEERPTPTYIVMAETGKVERKDVDAAEEERPTPTYMVMATSI